MKAVLLFPILLLFQWACVPAQPHPVPHSSQPTSAPDTALVYRYAIGEYIAAMTKRDGSFPDTLYINRHDAFPDIELPTMFQDTHVRMLAPSEAETVKSAEHFVCLNVLGWFSDSTVQFHLINFRQDWRHRPDGRDDCHLYYSIGSQKNEFVVDSLRFSAPP
ncbi:MAG: hypothetical protein IPO17_03025 [Flavobacteriales bacterium]|nr:hypothetical protein [Flavobacteriales bacterium]MBK9193957.1 hypothetical protein [Flavobacteriales bacterium]